MTRLVLNLAVCGLALLGVTSLVYAQQPAPPRDQALTQRLITEINSNLACSTSLIEAQQQVARLQAEIKAKEAPADKKQDRLLEKKKP